MFSNVLFALALLAPLVSAAPASAPPPATTAVACTSVGQGTLSAHTTDGTQAAVEMPVSLAATRLVVGGTAGVFEFLECSSTFIGETGEDTTNGTVFFGHIVPVATPNTCLSVPVVANVTTPFDISSGPCSTADDDSQINQFFSVLDEDTFDVEFIGHKKHHKHHKHPKHPKHKHHKHHHHFHFVLGSADGAQTLQVTSDDNSTATAVEVQFKFT
ncbi:hypothetical protein BV25DRAFT_1832257 [Artomyces pyxidatus]|uniref:Uncharacterized protein n=1 Tax=Artomyces pyxidatus TaxID=48021 RepID=A0ACB8SJE0_9AGAM|nr:hypothetical protein BV25DRAFT_1832257 [Artomyces pyxidatus]